jgi:hypothetical protein
MGHFLKYNFSYLKIAILTFLKCLSLSLSLSIFPNNLEFYSKKEGRLWGYLDLETDIIRFTIDLGFGHGSDVKWQDSEETWK